MFNLKKLKTPHRMPTRHAVHMLVLFFCYTMLMTLLGYGVADSDSVSAISLGFALILSSLFSLVLGTLTTATIRATLNLIQTGRVIQFIGFWFFTSLSLALTSALFTSSLTLFEAVRNGFGIFALTFASAYAIGEIPWRGRTWLPMKRKGW